MTQLLAMSLNRSLLLSVLLNLLGCGGLFTQADGETRGCDFREEGKTEQRCQERSFGAGGQVATVQFEQLCSFSQGVVRETGCDTAHRVGGCELDTMTIIAGTETGQSVVDWYYEPMTEAQVRETCDREGQPFLEP